MARKRTSRRVSRNVGARKVGTKRPRVSARPRARAHSISEVLAATRAAYAHVLGAFGMKASKRELEKAIYIDKRGNWLRPAGSGILISYETGLLESPLWSEWGMKFQDMVNDVLRRRLGKGYYIEDLNGALATVVSEGRSGGYTGGTYVGF